MSIHVSIIHTIPKTGRLSGKFKPFCCCNVPECRSVPALRTCSRQIEPPAGQLEDFAALASFSSRDRAANRRFCLASPPPSSAAPSILLMLRRPPPHFLPPALLKDSRLNKSDLYRSIFAPICRRLNTLFTLVLVCVCATNNPAYLCFVFCAAFFFV